MLLFSYPKKTMKILSYIQWARTKEGKWRIVCLCLASNKQCNKKCEKVILNYNQYRGMRECQKNKDGNF